MTLGKILIFKLKYHVLKKNSLSPIIAIRIFFLFYLILSIYAIYAIMSNLEKKFWKNIHLTIFYELVAASTWEALKAFPGAVVLHIAVLVNLWKAVPGLYTCNHGLESLKTIAAKRSMAARRPWGAFTVLFIFMKIRAAQNPHTGWFLGFLVFLGVLTKTLLIDASVTAAPQAPKRVALCVELTFGCTEACCSRLLSVSPGSPGRANPFGEIKQKFA